MQAGCQVPLMAKSVYLQRFAVDVLEGVALRAGASGKSCRANVAGAPGKSY
jgi:hypothetical protein